MLFATKKKKAMSSSSKAKHKHSKLRQCLHGEPVASMPVAIAPISALT